LTVRSQGRKITFESGGIPRGDGAVMSLKSLQNAMSGLEAAERRFNTTANNVANLRSEGFRPSRATNADVESGGVKVSISRAGAEALQSGTLESGTNLVNETRESSVAVNAYRANIAAARAAEEIAGVTVSLGGIRE
jgi:flagellar basal body rod protein FlgC